MTQPISAAPPAPLVVTDLSIDFWVEGVWNPAAIDVNFTLEAGEVLAIVGESGSGKSTIAMSLIGLLAANSRVSGSITLNGKELVGASPSALRKVRGKEAAVIFQEPMTALNPVMTVGTQIAESLRIHGSLGPKAAHARAIELLRLVEIPDPEVRVNSYPHQLSGGQRQRAMIAQSLACDPTLLIADEPTTALDVTVQAEILDLMRDLRNRVNAAIILITHDMGVVADLADRVLVMKNGIIVESGAAADIFASPQHPYTQQLLAAVPHLGGPSQVEPAGGLDLPLPPPDSVPHPAPAPAPAASSPVPPAMRAVDLVIEYPARGRTPAFRAINSVSLSIAPGEVVGLVGESGSGKSTIGRAVVGLLPASSGELTVAGINLVGLPKGKLGPVREQVGMVFQDPGSSLNPRFPIGISIGEPLQLHHKVSGKAELSIRVEELLDSVQLPHALRNRYPHELSGGQRQRVGIARALALNPRLLVADEPTSALDVSVQARVLELFGELQRDLGFACLFISHDLAVVEILADRIAVLNHGRLAEVGTTTQILYQPQDAYTQRLLAAVPVPDPAEQRRRRLARAALAGGTPAR